MYKEKKDKKKMESEDVESTVDKKRSTRWKDMIDFSICKEANFIILCLAINLSIMAYFVPAYFLPCKWPFDVSSNFVLTDLFT